MQSKPTTFLYFSARPVGGAPPPAPPRRYCPALEAPVEKTTVLRPDGTEAVRKGRFGIPPIVFDRTGDVAAAQAAPPVGGSQRSNLARLAIEQSCPIDPVSLMRTEIAPLCKESYIATLQAAPYTSGATSAVNDGSMYAGPDGLDVERRVPQLIVKDSHGTPIPGRSCVIEDVGMGSPLGGAFDISPFGMSYTCGPSDANGVITISDLTFHGGSSRALNLRVSVDGQIAVPELGSRWRFDGTIYYVSTDQPSFAHVNTIIVGGHGSVYLFVCVSLVAMSLNAISPRHNSVKRAPFTLRLLGLLAILGLVYTTSSYFGRHFMRVAHGDRDVGKISMLSMRDMVASRVENLSFEAWFGALLAMFLGMFIVGNVSVLWLVDQWTALCDALTIFLGATGGDRVLAWLRASKCYNSLLSCGDRGSAIVRAPVDCMQNWMGRDDTRVATGFRKIVMVFSKIEENFGACELKWQKIEKRPDEGVAIINDKLAATLVAKAEQKLTGNVIGHVITFSQFEWDEFGISHIRLGHFIQAGDGVYYEPVKEGLLEPPPYMYIFGVQFRSLYESRATRRMRAARNYVRKLLRGRKWLASQLIQHQNVINLRNSSLIYRNLSMLLGLSTRVHPHLPYMLRDDFFFPERFYFAAILSLWLQFLISLGFIGASRACYAYTQGLGIYLLQMDAMSSSHMPVTYSDQSGGSTTSAMPITAIGLTMLANGYRILGFGSSMRGFVDALNGPIFGALQAIAVISGILAFVLHIFLWIAFFRRYRLRLFQMRTGRYFFNPRRFDETGASSFIGYKSAFMLLSTGVLMSFTFCALSAIAGIIIALIHAANNANNSFFFPPPRPLNSNNSFFFPSIAYPPSPPGANFTQGSDAFTAYAAVVVQAMQIGGVPAIVFWAIGGFFFQYAFNKLCWFAPAEYTRDGEIRNRWVRFRFWYAIYEYLLILPNLCIGLIFIAVRMFFAFLMWIYFTFSMDICLVPSATGLEFLDAGHAAYVAAARSDHRYNNPIVMVTVQILQESLRKHRLEGARLKVRSYLRKLSVARAKGELAAFVEETARRREEEEAAMMENAEAGDGLCLDSGGSLRKDDPEALSPKARRLSEAVEAAIAQHEAFSTLDTMRRRRKVLRRWQLARMLLVNPALRNMRAHARPTANLPEPKHVTELYGELGRDAQSAMGSLGSRARAASNAVGKAAMNLSPSKRAPPAGLAPDVAPGLVLDADGNWVEEGRSGSAWSSLGFPELRPSFELPSLPELPSLLQAPQVQGISVGALLPELPSVPSLPQVSLPQLPSVRIPGLSRPAPAESSAASD